MACSHIKTIQRAWANPMTSWKPPIHLTSEDHVQHHHSNHSMGFVLKNEWFTPIHATPLLVSLGDCHGLSQSPIFTMESSIEIVFSRAPCPNKARDSTVFNGTFGTFIDDKNDCDLLKKGADSSRGYSTPVQHDPIASLQIFIHCLFHLPHTRKRGGHGLGNLSLRRLLGTMLDTFKTSTSIQFGNELSTSRLHIYIYNMYIYIYISIVLFQLIRNSGRNVKSWYNQPSFSSVPGGLEWACQYNEF